MNEESFYFLAGAASGALGASLAASLCALASSM
jgi:hypothetical protein